jgi:hypothetical protein
MTGRSCLLAALVATSIFAITRANALNVPHLEMCTQWSVEDKVFGFVNKCSQSVAVLFMPFDSQLPTEREVAEGERFSTGYSQSKLESVGWISARCPAGFGPSVPFTFENRHLFYASRYTCVPK